ncbi:MAG: hypothetical protein PHD03_02795 [Bacilli bacterium]|nr:hypothetical protein [Bacilli bacterium]MDD4407054.1 hypothetical protein [Bacilli bacterium]
MTKIDNHRMILNSIYMGMLVEVIMFKDGTTRTSNYFIAFEKLEEIIGIVGSNPYILYKDIFSNDTFYINKKGNVIYNNNIKEISDINRWKIKIINFYSLKDVLIKARNLLELVSELHNFSYDYYKEFKELNIFVNQCLDDYNFVEVDSKLLRSLNDNLETIYGLVLDETEESIVNKFSNDLSNISRQKFIIVNKKNKKENISEDSKHLKLIKNDDDNKLT